MKNYEVLADLGVNVASYIEKAFDRGYEQGYQDGKLDGEAEKIEKLEKKFDDEKKYEYKRGYEQGRRSTITIKDFEEYYHEGLKHGQELKAKEAECAEACGLRKGWETARKILQMTLDDVDQVFPGWDVEHIIEKLSAKEVIEKLEAWEEKQKQDAPETNVGSIENRDKIVKALAGLLAAYGEQFWDVVADMQKKP